MKKKLYRNGGFLTGEVVEQKTVPVEHWIMKIVESRNDNEFTTLVPILGKRPKFKFVAVKGSIERLAVGKKADGSELRRDMFVPSDVRKKEPDEEFKNAYEIAGDYAGIFALNEWQDWARLTLRAAKRVFSALIFDRDNWPMLSNFKQELATEGISDASIGANISVQGRLSSREYHNEELGTDELRLAVICRNEPKILSSGYNPFGEFDLDPNVEEADNDSADAADTDAPVM